MQVLQRPAEAGRSSQGFNPVSVNIMEGVQNLFRPSRLRFAKLPIKGIAKLTLVGWLYETNRPNHATRSPMRLLGRVRH
jgi:hypothetical protein